MRKAGSRLDAKETSYPSSIKVGLDTISGGTRPFTAGSRASSSPRGRPGLDQEAVIDPVFPDDLV